MDLNLCHNVYMHETTQKQAWRIENYDLCFVRKILAQSAPTSKLHAGRTLEAGAAGAPRRQFHILQSNIKSVCNG